MAAARRKRISLVRRFHSLWRKAPTRVPQRTPAKHWLTVALGSAGLAAIAAWAIRVGVRSNAAPSANGHWDLLWVASTIAAAGFLAGTATTLALARSRRRRPETNSGGRSDEGKDRLAMFIAGSPTGVAMFDQRMTYLAASKRYAETYGLEQATLIGRSHYEVFPDVPERWREVHGRVMAGGTESQEEDSFPRTNGRTDWVRWRMEPWCDRQGVIGGALLFSEVITPQVESRRARLEAEAKLQAIFETAVDAIVVIDEAGVIQSANPATELLFGYDVEELIGQNVSMLMPDPDRTAHDSLLADYMRTGSRRVIGRGREVEGVTKAGAPVPIDLAVAEWRLDDRRYFTGIMRDVTDRKIAEAERMQSERRELVVAELGHRISNIFAVIQAMVVASARACDDVGTYRDAMLTRIGAFANTQLGFARQSSPGSDLRQLLDLELRPYIDDERRVTLDGPDLSLGESASGSLAMVFHELATNAAKYGALSQRRTSLTVSWSIVPDADGERLSIHWEERGGPLVAEPTRRGFGARVIERSAQALGGQASLKFFPEGLVCDVEIPLAGVIAGKET